MKFLNIVRLIEASPFADRVNDEAREALIDFIDECYENITELNIDEILINVMTISKKSFDKEYKRDEVTVLHKSEHEVTFLQ